MIALKAHFDLLRAFFHSEFRKIFLLTAISFFSIGIVGCIVGMYFPDLIETMITSFMESAQANGVITEDGEMSLFALMSNNWTAMLFSVAYGLIPFLFLPLLTLVVNAFLLGIVAAMYLLSGLPMIQFAAGLIPHGIFEFPAIILSIACGFYLCLHMSRLVTGSPRKAPSTEAFVNVLRVLVLLIAPMTVAAALIEVYITPLVMLIFS